MHSYLSQLDKLVVIIDVNLYCDMQNKIPPQKT